jgi:hypothetical protein
MAEKTDNSLDIEGLLYHDFVCNSTTDSLSPSTAQPVTAFTGHYGSAMPIVLAASNGEVALFNENIQCRR